MTRAQFLNDLYRLLAGNGMDAEQAEQHLTYYAEMLADRMEEGMSEDQAVSSMEDVDTIARRVLEEEGLPYRPLREIPMKPPAAPDVSPGRGRRTYQAPKKWSGRKLAQAALWALAATVALGAVSRWLLGRGSNTRVDYAASAPVEEAAPYAEWDDTYGWEAPYNYGYEYGGDMNALPVGSFDTLDIQWAAGTVLVQSWSGDEIQIQEFAGTELNERTAMHLEQDGGTLSIRYRNGVSLGNVKGGKWLTVMVPDGMLAELDIETTSADVQLNGLEVNELDVSTASGDISAAECYTQWADLDTISGDMDLNSFYAAELDLGTTSGDLYGTVAADDLEASSISGDITLNSSETMESASLKTTSGYIRFYLEDPSAQSIGVSSVSGDVSLSLPYGSGFTLMYSTVSGSLNNTGFDMVQRDGKYVYDGGGCEIAVETVSGNLDIY